VFGKATLSTLLSTGVVPRMCHCVGSSRQDPHKGISRAMYIMAGGAGMPCPCCIRHNYKINALQHPGVLYHPIGTLVWDPRCGIDPFSLPR
jgi:hypothetical protein